MKCCHFWILATLLGLGSEEAAAQLCPENFDAAAAPVLPDLWTSNAVGAGVAWVTAPASHHSAPNAAFAPNIAGVGSSYLVSPSTHINGTNATLTFFHWYATEKDYDGGALEISINDGPYADILAAGGTFIAGGYNTSVSSSFDNPLAGRQAWGGSSGGYVATTVQLPASAIGTSVRLRWHMATDKSVAATGWRVDSIVCGPAPTGNSPWRHAEQPYPTRIMDQATTVMGDVLYSFGGWITPAPTKASYKYDGALWTPIGELPAARRYLTAVSNASHIFILGGLDASHATSNAVYRYAPQTNTYETMAPFSTAVRGAGAVLLGGRIFKIGGTIDAAATATNAVEIYDIASNTWTQGAPYPLALGFVSVFTRNGYMYGAGGFDGASVATTKTYRYDPALNLWDDAPIPDLPEPRAAAALIDMPKGALLAGGFVGGGIVSGNTSASVILWDAAANVWRPFPSLIAARTRPGGGYLRGLPTLVGGAGVISAQSDVQVYNERLLADGFE